MTADISTESRLSYIIEILRELFKLLDKDQFRVLAYIISMAITEAEDVFRKEVLKRDDGQVPA